MEPVELVVRSRQTRFESSALRKGREGRGSGCLELFCFTLVPYRSAQVDGASFLPVGKRNAHDKTAMTTRPKACATFNFQYNKPFIKIITKRKRSKTTTKKTNPITTAFQNPIHQHQNPQAPFPSLLQSTHNPTPFHHSLQPLRLSLQLIRTA